MTFDEKRVGCGMSHPLIKVGAKGFFKGDFLHSLSIPNGWKEGV